ncbi:10434_t:CDS:1, partial [Funneliformis caledonium]
KRSYTSSRWRLELILHKEKKNQGGAFYRNKHGKTNSRHIPIPSDTFNYQYTPAKDILLFCDF